MGMFRCVSQLLLRTVFLAWLTAWLKTSCKCYRSPLFLLDDNFKKSNQPAHPLDLIYDISSLSNLLLKYKLPKLATFERFLQHGSRDVIVVHYISPKETHELIVMEGEVKKTIEGGFRVQPVVNCNDHLSRYRNTIEKALNDELGLYQSLTPRNQFHISKYWCVNMSAFSTPKESALKMEFGSGDATIVVVNWRGLGKGKFVKNSVRGFHLNNRIAMFNACSHHLSTSWRNIIYYSPIVEQTAQRYAVSLGLSPGDKFAAVHIRSEKLGLREPRLPGVTVGCFDELMRLKQRVAQEHPSIRFVYVTDYGLYSSDTCKKCRGSRDVKQFFLDRNIRNTYFDPAHFNVTIDSGFAAAVESQFLASANFLFLCGGGGYQNQISTRFDDLKYRTHSNDKEKAIFRVCNDDSDIHRLLKLHQNITSGT